MFEPYVGDTFRVRVGKQIVDLKLVAITNEKPASEKIACTDCFSMRFEAVKPLPRATLHTLNHSKLGRFDLFMVRIERQSKVFANSDRESRCLANPLESTAHVIVVRHE